MTGQSPISLPNKRPDSKGSQARAPTPTHDDLMNIPPMFHIDGMSVNPFDANSYRVLDNLKRGIDPEENKNTKVTLELL